MIVLIASSPCSDVELWLSWNLYKPVIFTGAVQACYPYKHFPWHGLEKKSLFPVKVRKK